MLLLPLLPLSPLLPIFQMWHTNEHESALESVTSPFKSEIWENDGTRL